MCSGASHSQMEKVTAEGRELSGLGRVPMLGLWPCKRGRVRPQSGFKLRLSTGRASGARPCAPALGTRSAAAGGSGGVPTADT